MWGWGTWLGGGEPTNASGPAPWGPVWGDCALARVPEDDWLTTLVTHRSGGAGAK